MQSSKIGDPVSLDFDLLVTSEGSRAAGVERFADQYRRANIEPTEQYVSTPPGSTKHRLPAGGFGFANLHLAGDWINTGLNVGSVEVAVMGGMLAARSLDATLPSDDIYAHFH